MNTTLPRRILSIIGRRRGVLLRVLAAVLAVAMLAAAIGRAAPARADGAQCIINGVIGPCPTSTPIPLLYLDGLYAANAAQTASLQNLEQQAVTNTIHDHQLPSSDAAAVLTWGRDDAEAELWALLVQAIETPACGTGQTPGQGCRTADQQNAADWLSAANQEEAYSSDIDAGVEYARFAGFDPGGFSQLANTGAGESALQNYLCGGSGGNCNSGAQVEPYYPSQSSATGGYCAYQPPAPYQGDFSDSHEQTCYTGCTSYLGCPPVVPSADQFGQWGAVDAAAAIGETSAAFAQTSQQVAVGLEFGGTIVATGLLGVAISQALSGVLAGTAGAGLAIAEALLPHATEVATFFAADSAAAALEAGAIVGEIAASSVGAIVVTVVAAVVTAVLVGINVFNTANIPSDLANDIVTARNSAHTTPDLSTTLATTSGAQTLYSLFIAATLPAPSGPPPIPDPTLTDPLFSIQAKGATTATDAESMSWQEGTTTQPVDITARLSGNWFVEQTTAADGSPITSQSLRINYIDWAGVQRIAWLVPALLPNGAGYQFAVIKDPAGDSSASAFNPSTCGADGTCSTSSSIDYMGTDGNDYSASVVHYQAPTVTTMAGPNPVEGTPQSFSASATAPLPGQTVTYQWQFEQPQASGGGFTSPISGADVSYAWPTSGTYHVQLTATDSFQRTQVQTFTVTVGDVPPTLALNPTSPVSAGHGSTLTGTITHAGSADTEAVTVDWGDGASDVGSIDGSSTIQIGIGDSPTLGLSNASDTVIDLSDTHTYAKPGVYTVTVTAQDQSNATVKASATEIVQGGPQTINFAPIPAHTYGDAPFSISATGGASEKPVTFKAGPPDVCSISGLAIGTDSNGDASYGATVTLLGVGTCGIDANQAGTNAPGGVVIYPPAEPVERSFQVNPAPLSITANNKSMTYGGTVPSFDAGYAGFVNGDTVASLGHAAECEPTTDPRVSPVGTYPITCRDALDRNYTISYVNGTLTIGQAPLSIMANDKSMTYGGTVPSFDAGYSGFVNGDHQGVVTGLICGAVNGSGNPVSSSTPAGTYPIACSGGKDANYNISYKQGILTITPAALTITADDQRIASGQPLPSPFPVTANGLVDADTLASLQGTLVVATTATQASAPGTYSLTPGGLSSPNYTITYASGTLTIDPLLSLDEQGLPSTVSHQATLDGKTVSLPDTGVEVPYGSPHSYRFPATVTDSAGTVYITNDPGFSGAFTANRTDTATYQTMAQVVGAALASGGIDSGGQASALTQQFAAVQQDLAAGNTAQALADLHTFADHVRAQSGKHVSAATAQALLADAQLVYAGLGGTGTV